MTNTVQYANAKIVLLGDTGVGKSGLGLVLTGRSFAATESTHGRHIWTFSTEQIELENDRIENREVFLWDLAGQPGYRLIHQLHLDEVAVALVVFDARNEIDPFAGIKYWDRALRQAQLIQGDAALPVKKFLVAARSDRGGIAASTSRIEQLKETLGFEDYIATSAKEGWNIPTLINQLHQAIHWEVMPRTNSTSLFQQIKAFLFKQKQFGHLLATATDLYRTFLQSDQAPPETSELRIQFNHCIQLVESRGLIRRLGYANFILLQPELLDAYASALVNAAKNQPEGLGSIEESKAKAGDFAMPFDERITDRELEKLLLISTVEDLLHHEIALREPAEVDAYLIVPTR